MADDSPAPAADPGLDQAAPAPAPPPMWPLPDRRHLVLIAIGLVVGVLLSPAVLGRVSPGLYAGLFLGSGESSEALIHELEEIERSRAALAAFVAESDVSAAALEEQGRALDDRREVLNKALAYERLRSGLVAAASLLLGLVAALVVVTIFEAVIGPRPSRRGRAVLTPTHARATTIRYAIVAAIVAVLIARPALLAEVSWPFVTLLLAVIAVAGFVPLGKKA